VSSRPKPLLTPVINHVRDGMVFLSSARAVVPGPAALKAE
jgi:hypothetical protein